MTAFKDELRSLGYTDGADIVIETRLTRPNTSDLARMAAANHLDTVWPYWNLMDFTPEGRPDIPIAPQKFRSEFLEKNYLNKE